MKFFVTGSAGLIGSQVVKDLVRSNHQVYSCYNDSRPRDGIAVKLDLTNNENIVQVVQTVKPDVIIHLAAMTNVDLCEKEKDLALKINAKSTQIISKQAAKHDSFFVYVSTDYVFDGETGMKKESDTPNPVDYYGYSKYQGEIAVQDMASSWCIARTSTPFGIHDTKKSFPSFVIENLQAKKEISVVIDQYTSPTYVPNLSKMLIEISTRQTLGIIHLAGATRISRYDMAQLVAEKLDLDKSLLRQASIKGMDWIAKRPKDSSLDVLKAASLLKEKPISVEQGLDQFIEEIKTKPN
ncbi:MAG TPA: dTDP-4-dehydrorhamnose reductase [Candidatus Nitrosotalea sp.]|nr:dTDP-4-dehydrorhamnose reductase [Candidatus Nitrosotalea sp.]